MRLVKALIVISLMIGFALPSAMVSADGPNLDGGASLGAPGQTSTADANTVTNPLMFVNGMSLRHGGYVAAGVAMRNRGYGTVTLSTIPPGSQIVAAYLFWDILANSQQTSFAYGELLPASRSNIRRRFSFLVPFFNTSISGSLIGAGADPCWGNSHNYAYAANVTQWVTGNGSYYLSGFASGTTNGQDPWSGGSTAPMIEGASLVVFYSNRASPPTDVVLYDGNFASAGSSLPFPLGTQTIGNFAAPDIVTNARTTFIVADGQSNGGKPGSTFNGQQLSIRYNGLDHQDGPNFSNGNLWDTQTVDVTSFISPGDTSATATLQGGPDCLVWVAQVFSVSGSASGVSAAGLVLPFSRGQTWYVCQGYNGQISHKLIPALDLSISPNSVGNRGCTPATSNASTGQKVFSPLTGIAIQLANPQFVCVNSLSTNTSVLVGHIGNRIASGRLVRAGITELGTVDPPDSSSSNQGYAHIHIQAFEYHGCGVPGNPSIPFDSTYGTRFQCAPNMPYLGDSVEDQYAKQALTRCR